ncbi:hypothetical protein GCM10023178_18540 [Actinomadura luteofluorescens]
MDAPDLASDSMAIVINGTFDPIRITPHWLRQMDLIALEDYESQEIEVISRGVAIVKYGSIQLRVASDKLQVATDEIVDIEAARDLATGILLSKGAAAIASMGINRAVHFEAAIEKCHAIGDLLAPKKYWSDLVDLPGMADLTIKAVRKDGYGGNINVQVQPSVIVRPGVYVSINDHKKPTLRFPRKKSL